jgi:hypothetical protein
MNDCIALSSKHPTPRVIDAVRRIQAPTLSAITSCLLGTAVGDAIGLPAGTPVSSPTR